jgi:hypothetical protein
MTGTVALFDDAQLEAACNAFMQRAGELGYDATVVAFTGVDLLHQTSIAGGSNFIARSAVMSKDNPLLQHFAP